MTKWRAVILVPRVVDIEYASDIKTAMRGAMAAMKQMSTVDSHTPKLLELIGPKEDLDAWGSEQRAKYESEHGINLIPEDDDDDGGPSAA